ncbi:ankyrin repeat-containing protein At5g02620-like [Pistacia vera]|uniref:ankyrin repeat-containing protein At5g02620-like n=1 Tax=Pistacia vera TaxID=55513 RepID=UPI001262B23D|nr:ankyrin repeat-containing protein At5g02620-like [Pistacia vera]
MANGNLNPLSVPIPIFTGRKYDTWRIKMETYFLSQDLWDIVNEGISTPDNTSTLSEQQQKQLKESSQKNAAALYILQQAVEDDIFSKIYEIKTAKEAWTALKKEFQGNTQPTALSDEDKKQCEKYLPLYKAILEGSLETVQLICHDNKEALKARITVNWDTALHVAVGIGTCKENDIVKYPLDEMSIDDLAQQNKEGNTILSIAAIVGNVRAASMILMKNKYKTLIQASNNSKRIPLIEAARHDQKKMIEFLLPFSNSYFDYADLTGFGDDSGFSFLNSLIIAGFYGLALKLLHIHGNLTTKQLPTGESLLSTIAGKPSAFRSGQQTKRKFLQFFKDCIFDKLMNRQKKVLRLISGRSGYKHMLLQSQDIDKNNVLHFAGKPKSKANQLSSAALNMQQELQWFKKVEKMVPPDYRKEKNSEGKTPRMVFIEEHKELIKEGEERIKGVASSCSLVASSCSLVASFITTIVFAAAITIPGDYNDDGHPNLYEHTAFTIFSIFNSFCFFTTIGAIIMFVSIRTSRYGEEDFLFALPKQLTWCYVIHPHHSLSGVS